MMLGLLLARAGVNVVVLEKHQDFLRDFRGDTIHPSTLEVMHELGLLERFLQLPHQRAESFNVFRGEHKIEMVNFKHLPVVSPFVALMPQWDFLNFLAEEGKQYPGFNLKMSTEATDLIFDDNQRVVGAKAKSSNGKTIEIEAPLVVAADGRTSVLRDRAGLKVRSFGVPIDVLWFRIQRQPEDGDEMGVKMRPGRLVVMLNRGDYWQCAYVIAKDASDDIKRQGLDAFCTHVAESTGFGKDRLAELSSWDDVKLLRVAINRLDTWYRDGFLAIGDAAHAMSPVGGVGVNLAIQDAVVTANRLHQTLRNDEVVSKDLLHAIQKRRLWPTRVIQKIQAMAHKDVIEDALAAGDDDPDFVPAPVRIMQKLPWLQRIPARIVGLGIRMEHVAPELRA